jgi:hypothetical protein
VLKLIAAKVWSLQNLSIARGILKVSFTERVIMEKVKFEKMVIDAVDKMLLQNKQSLIEGHGCMYRGPENTCCIVGFMLDDPTANSADELGGNSVAALIEEGIWEVDLTDYQSVVLSKLQHAHDSASVNQEFNPQFIAYISGLPVLNFVSEHISNA